MDNSYTIYRRHANAHWWIEATRDDKKREEDEMANESSSSLVAMGGNVQQQQPQWWNANEKKKKRKSFRIILYIRYSSASLRSRAAGDTVAELNRPRTTRNKKHAAARVRCVRCVCVRVRVTIRRPNLNRAFLFFIPLLLLLFGGTCSDFHLSRQTHTHTHTLTQHTSLAASTFLFIHSFFIHNVFESQIVTADCRM